MRTLDVAAQAGAVALAKSQIAVGTRTGVARFASAEVGPTALLGGLWEDGCDGLQFADGGLVMLGHDVGQSFAKPADWKHSLVHLDDQGNLRRVPIGAGNWTMVKGLYGTIAVLYDISEHQGARAVSTDEATCSWWVPEDFRRIISVGGDRLLGLAEPALVEISVTRGPLDVRYDIPSCGGTTWTATAVRGAEYLLGGYSQDRSEYVFARWQPPSTPKVRRTPVSDVFPPSQIQAALADEDHCGADLFHVAAIRVAPDGRIVLALGGDGERLGACQSACAIARLDPSTLELSKSRVIDEFDGASGFLLGDDGTAVVNCCDSVHVLPATMVFVR